MKEICIDLVYADIEEVIRDKHRNLVIKFKNGDKISMQRNEKSDRIYRHLARQFPGDHLDRNL